VENKDTESWDLRPPSRRETSESLMIPYWKKKQCRGYVYLNPRFTLGGENTSPRIDKIMDG